MKCPNCSQEHGVEDSCFLGLLLGVVSDRLGGLTDSQVQAVMDGVNVDWLWEAFGGPAADFVEALVKDAG